MDIKPQNPSSSTDELQQLYSQLGKVLYEHTKDDERMYLLAPSIYLSIAKLLKENNNE